MDSKDQIIRGLQAIVTGLSQQADGHMIQSKIFSTQGLKKLAEKYANHSRQERLFVEELILRILDLGGDVKNEATMEVPVHTDAIDWIKYDLKLSGEGLLSLKKLMESTRDDYATFDLLKKYYEDEERDMYWAEEQLDLIEKLGEQNWYLTLV